MAEGICEYVEDLRKIRCLLCGDNIKVQCDCHGTPNNRPGFRPIFLKPSFWTIKRIEPEPLRIKYHGRKR